MGAVKNAICAGFAEAPANPCYKILHDQNLQDVDVMFAEDEYSYSYVFFICFSIMMTVFIILCIYRRHAKRKMREEINVQIADAVN